MATSSEKIDQLQQALRPELGALLEGLGRPIRMAAQLVIPQAEEWLDRELTTRSAGELDELLARVIDRLGSLRSDDAAALFVDADGARYGGDPLGDPVRGPDLRGGGDGDREVGVGAGAVPVGGGASAGDRPG